MWIKIEREPHTVFVSWVFSLLSFFASFLYISLAFSSFNSGNLARILDGSGNKFSFACHEGDGCDGSNNCTTRMALVSDVHIFLAGCKGGGGRLYNTHKRDREQRQRVFESDKLNLEKQVLFMATARDLSTQIHFVCVAAAAASQPPVSLLLMMMGEGAHLSVHCCYSFA